MARILIIDDDEQILDLLGQMLGRAGYETIGASNGREGLERQREAPADLVIADLLMPEKEGLETIGELKRDYPRTKIIAISGGGRLGTQDFLPLALKLGAARALAKPFTRDQLLDAVRQVLD